MLSLLGKLFKILILLVLVIVFFASIGAFAFTWKYPAETIDLINKINPTPTRIPLPVKGVAVLGDSQSDEYRADDNRGANYSSNTLNWVEILAQKRKINFGEWGTWNDIRRTGYENNWARTGATAFSMIESGQHVGVAEQVKQGKVNTVIMYIGANDYSPLTESNGFIAIYNGTATPAQLTEKRNYVVADIKTAIEVIRGAGKVQILLVTIPDWGNNFGVRLAFPLPEGRARVSQEINTVNTEIAQMASAYSIPILDANEFYKTLPKAKDGSVQVGHVKLEQFLINNDPKNMFLEDGVHPGTVLNALFANAIIEKLNHEFGTSIKPLSTKEILSIAGL